MAKPRKNMREHKRDSKRAEAQWRAGKGKHSPEPVTNKNQLTLGTILKWVVPVLVLVLILTY